MLECVVNISEGRDADCVAAISGAAGDDLLDVHTDADHHRSVLTLVGEVAPHAVTRAAVARIDLTRHRGAHPRLGAVDVVPFVPLDGSSMGDAIAARDGFARWAADELGVPCFCYGPERTLPDIRRHAFTGLAPDTGPAHPHPTAGAIAVGARGVLVAYNLWLAEPDLALARALAAELRSPEVRTLGLAVGDEVQVSINLVAPTVVGPAEVYDRVRRRTPIARAELVGLLPASVLRAIPPHRWSELDVAESTTIEARLEERSSSRA